MNVITYYSINAVPAKAWTAHIVLPNGNYWGVRFEGATEEIARTKAVSLWNKEQERFRLNQKPTNNKPFVKSAQPSSDDPQDENSMADDPWASLKQHHRAGKVWMRHKENRDLISIPLTEIIMYEQSGYERGGPRSK